jgi:hypothetical protein
VDVEVRKPVYHVTPYAKVAPPRNCVDNIILSTRYEGGIVFTAIQLMSKSKCYGKGI